MALEGFIPSEGGEGMSEAALESLREKMKAAAAQIAAIKKEEGKQKKKEDELLKILLKFIQDSHKKDLIGLISRALAVNVPANFILAIALLGNEDIQEQIGRFISLPSGNQEQSLVFFREDQTLPLKVKIQLDQWVKGLLLQAEETPQKLLKRAYEYQEEKKIVRKELVDLFAFVVKDFLLQNNIEEPYMKLRNFANFILKGLLTKVEETLENRRFLD